MKVNIIILSFFLLLGSAVTGFTEVVVNLNHLTPMGLGASAGQIRISESAYGLVFTPALKGLSPGLHGFHVHQNPSCDTAEKAGKQVPGLAAGGHFDPHGTNQHGFPWGNGHLGDLPALNVDQAGLAKSPVLAPRLKLEDIRGRALMVHSGGDNYSDQPAKLGGGGARMVCGVID